LKTVTTKILVKLEADESVLTEENINRYKEDTLRLIESETDENAVIEVIVEVN
jgi:hypothetical protein